MVFSRTAASDPHSRCKTPLGYASVGALGPQGALAQPWAVASNRYAVNRTNHNTVTASDAQDPDWDTTSYPIQPALSLIVTDGRTEPDEDGDPQPLTWPFLLRIRPNVDITSSLWKANSPVPQHDFLPWVSGLSSPSDSMHSWTVTAGAQTSSLKSQHSETVGGTDVDLARGTFRRYHDLVLDGSGGTSQMSLPGLVYDSSTVPPKPSRLV